MDPNRQIWNTQQKTLRTLLTHPEDHARAIALFLTQHAMLHAPEMAKAGVYSFEDSLWEEIPESAMRSIPKDEDHSMVWAIWHLARIEDMTMNVLVAGATQLLWEANWFKRMNVSFRDTGNAMNREEVIALSASIDIRALRDYRLAVGRRTREVVQRLPATAPGQKVQPSRLQQLWDEGAVVEGARGLLDYWGGLTIAGLLLMPPTRHNFVHLNEACTLKGKALRVKQS
jgi:hypothetical protein